jgi:GNAT superfamily N-acetyltransferase
MNAQPRETPDFRPMRPEDLPRVMEIERDLYPFPWTEGNFRDSLQAGYSCWVCQVAGHTVGYAVLMLVADEAHVLNIAIARAWQRRGLGSSLMRHLIGAGPALWGAGDFPRGASFQHGRAAPLPRHGLQRGGAPSQLLSRPRRPRGRHPDGHDVMKRCPRAGLRSWSFTPSGAGGRRPRPRWRRRRMTWPRWIGRR